jgi:hypothetical protein
VLAVLRRNARSMIPAQPRSSTTTGV